MTADQTLAAIDEALRRNEIRFDLSAGGVVDGAQEMRWRPRTTAVGPGWVPSLPVTFQEITEAAAVEQTVVEPVRQILTAGLATCDRVAGGSRTHVSQDADGIWRDRPCDCPAPFSVRSLLNRLIGRKP